MRWNNRISWLFVAPVGAAVVAMAAAAGCSATSADSTGGPATNGSANPTTTTPTSAGAAQRAIAEADIIQLDGGRLYAMSKSGTVSLVDVSTPGRLVLLGQTTLPGQPFEMYRRGGYLLAMSNGAVASDGTVVSPGSAWTGGWTTTTTEDSSGALLIVLDVQNIQGGQVTTTGGTGAGTSTATGATNPSTGSYTGLIPTLATFSVPGEIADSRVVGNVLYLATYENAACYGCGPAPRTMVTSFDITAATTIKQVEQVSFQSDAPDGYNLPWGANWKRSIFVTDQRLYIGGHADINPGTYGTTASANEGIIDVLDVTNPTGRFGVGARLRVAGAILSRWQLDETNGVLRVISQQGAGRTGNGLGPPEVDTFAVASAQTITPLGHMTMTLPSPEGLRTVRFDGPRAYAITYNQTDPMFVIDLGNPQRPVQRGELFMPGFMFYLEPHGDRVIGLGIDRTDPLGSLNVSLFDVSDPNLPRMLSRASFATPGITEDYEILNSEVSEDQDRIQKSFRVYSDGLVVAPFTALRSYSASDSSCANSGGGVQLVQWTGDTLVKRALLPLPGNPRRAFEYANTSDAEIITVSDSNVRSFSLANIDVAHETADVAIGTCTADTIAYPTGGWGGVNPVEGNAGGEYPRACSAAPGRARADWWLIALAGGALALRRRTRGRAR